MRLDKFLKVSRVIKRRTVANEACDNGRVRVNGRVAKAGTVVKPGDVVQVEFAGGSTKFEVLSVEENVRKSGAAEMYRIITSLILVFFICIGFLTGCTKSDVQEETVIPRMEANESYTLTVGSLPIYDEQFCYFFSVAASELSGGNYSNEWMTANLDATLDRTLEICREQAALYDVAVNSGFALSGIEDRVLINYISEKVEYNKVESTNEYLDVYDETCLKLTGMNYAEYRRYMRMCQPGEKLCRSLLEAYSPSEEEMLAYFSAHMDEFKTCSVGKIYISEDGGQNPEEVLRMVQSGLYPFTTIARGWSEDETVLDNDGYMDLCARDDTLPDELKQWIYACETPIDEKNAVMLHIEDDGYYILINKGSVGFADSSLVREQVLDAMRTDMLTEYKKEIAAREQYQIQEFDREKAVKLINSFVEGRQQ